MASNQPTPMLRRFALLGVVGLIALWIASPELFPGNSKLYDAIENGDEARARQLLEAGADPNSRSSGMASGRYVSRRYQFPPLLFAIWRNEPGIALLRSTLDGRRNFPVTFCATIKRNILYIFFEVSTPPTR